MKKILILILVLASCLVCLSYLPVHGEEQIYDSVVRLHVIANSDSDDDQALKLKVRDAVLAEMPSLLEGCTDRDSAVAALSASLDQIREIAQRTVNENGYAYTVSVSLGEEKYPSKSYESASFPAGTYTSLQIKLGDADGKNWWCVTFPSLCLPATAEGFGEKAVEAGLSESLSNALSGEDGYEIRFYLLDVLGRMENAFYEWRDSH